MKKEIIYQNISIYLRCNEIKKFYYDRVNYVTSKAHYKFKLTIEYSEKSNTVSSYIVNESVANEICYEIFMYLECENKKFINIVEIINNVKKKHNDTIESMENEEKIYYDSSNENNK